MRIVFVNIEQIRGVQLKRKPAGRLPCCLSAVVDNLGHWCEQDLPTRFHEPQTPIMVVTVDEECLIHRPNVCYCLATHKREASDHDIHLAYRVVQPARIALTAEKPLLGNTRLRNRASNSMFSVE